MHRQEFVPELRREIAQSLGDACLVLFPAAWLVLLTQRSLKQPRMLKRWMILKKMYREHISMILMMRVEGAYQLYISGAWQNTASPSSACSPRRWVHGVGTVDPCVARCAAKPKIRSLQLDWLSQSPVPPLPTHLHAPAHLIFRWGANSSTPFRWNCHVVEVTVQVSFQWFWPSHCLTAVFYRFWSQQPSGTRLDIMPCIRCVWGLREYCLRSLVMKDVNNSMMFNASIFMGAVLQQRWCTGNATWQRQHYLDALSSHSRFMMCY